MPGMLDYLNLAESAVTKKVLFDVCNAMSVFRYLPVEPTGVSSDSLAAAYAVVSDVKMAKSRALGAKPVNSNNSANSPTITKVPVLLSIFTEEMVLDSALRYQTESGDMSAVMTASTISSVAVANKIIYDMINGNKSTETTTFDGLKTLITGAPYDIPKGTLIDISSTCTEGIDKAGLKVSQALMGVIGKMGIWSPNLLLTNTTCSAPLIGALKAAGVANDVTFEGWGKDTGAVVVNGVGATVTTTKFGNLVIVGVPDEFLPANEDGTCDIFLVYCNELDGCRFLAPKTLYGKEGFIDVKVPQLDDNDVLSGGYAQSICSFVVPSKKQIARISNIKVTDATV